MGIVETTFSEVSKTYEYSGLIYLIYVYTSFPKVRLKTKHAKTI